MQYTLVRLIRVPDLLLKVFTLWSVGLYMK